MQTTTTIIIIIYFAPTQFSCTTKNMISPATAFCGLIYASLFFMAFDCLPFD
jgi:hypothetical protein